MFYVEYNDLIYSLGVILNYFGIGIIDVETIEECNIVITCIRKESRIWDLKTALS